MFRSFPCLWKIKSRIYSDRNKKAKAYERILVKLKGYRCNEKRGKEKSKGKI